ncbi:twin-arginine translocation signal domain-containing protein [Iamia majanohamensis]|uniref:Twin-arginine translocation signal domain-containing protein n=1 Tax=Iamia majanohamensis TaxID=467976 RepID=A0AAE9Y3X1_9ACTN|nr:twin-arginine translocation signal domain-containing protein [Iamia majanohamensis]WCO65659.1 twin-arginine translocation signal domain-containing protein [Iamia majanohamensis]
MGTSPPRLPDQTDTAADVDEPAGTSRRRFLTRAAAGGAVLVAGSQLVPGGLLPAAAQDEGGADDEDQDAELSSDEELVAHLASLCLAAARAFGLAVDPETSPLSEPVAEVVRQLGAFHTGQAAALNELLPVAVENTNSTLDQELSRQVAGASTDQDALLGVLRDLEEDLAATQYVMLGAIDDQNDARTIAQILPVTGQEVVVLGTLAGAPFGELVPAEQTAEGSLSLAAYPTDTEPGTGNEVSGEGPRSNEGGVGAETGEPADVEDSGTDGGDEGGASDVGGGSATGG